MNKEQAADLLASVIREKSSLVPSAVLLILASSPGDAMRSGEIAKKAFISSSHASNTLTALYNDRLVYPVRPTPRSPHKWKLTAKGIEKANKICPTN